MQPLTNLMERIPRWVYALGALAFVATLFWGGRQPVAVGLFPPPYDLAAHLVAYGVLTGLVWLSVRGRWPWLVVLAVALVGLADEYQQSLLPGRYPTWSDGAMDVLAAVLVVGFLGAWRKWSAGD